jgi:indole-3-glycerol phosphate synthase
MSDLLSAMMAASRERVAEARRVRPLERPNPAPTPHRFLHALAEPPHSGLALIAEIKRRSPSCGAIAPHLDAAAQARAYEAAGVDAISVLTEPAHFGGSLDDLRAAAGATRLPLLRKDFIVDVYQVWEAAVAGAAAVLLIAAGLDQATLTALLAESHACGLDALVEIHDERELRRALAARAQLVGINSRDLRTFTVDLRVIDGLAPLVPAGVLVVAESGISNGAGARRVRRAGAGAVLVGEALVRCPYENLAGLVTALRAEDGSTQQPHLVHLPPAGRAQR